MSFNAEISEGLDEIACEANVDLEYWRAETDEWIPLVGYIGMTPTDTTTKNGRSLHTQSRAVYVRDWQEQLVLSGEPFYPASGDRIRQGDLLVEVLPATTGMSFGGASNVELYACIGPDRRTMRINSKVVEGKVP